MTRDEAIIAAVVRLTVALLEGHTSASTHANGVTVEARREHDTGHIRIHPLPPLP